MRLLFLLLVGFIAVGALLYVFGHQQQALQIDPNGRGQAAQNAAADYKTNQEKMMKELQ